MSSEVGTLGWGLSVPSLANLETLEDKLTADSGYMTLVAEGAQHITDAGLTDSLVRLLYADPATNPDRTHYIHTAMAVAADGKAARAAEIGIEIAQRASAISGVPGTFGMQEYGVVGTFQWSTYCESLEQLEQGLAAVNADARFQELTTRGTEGLFTGAATQTLVRKIA